MSSLGLSEWVTLSSRSIQWEVRTPIKTLGKTISPETRSIWERPETAIKHSQTLFPLTHFQSFQQKLPKRTKSLLPFHQSSSMDQSSTHDIVSNWLMKTHPWRCCPSPCVCVSVCSFRFEPTITVEEVSFLLFLSKTLKQAIFNQVSSYLYSNNLLDLLSPQ